MCLSNQDMPLCKSQSKQQRPDHLFVLSSLYCTRYQRLLRPYYQAKSEKVKASEHRCQKIRDARRLTLPESCQFCGRKFLAWTEQAAPITPYQHPQSVISSG